MAASYNGQEFWFIVANCRFADFWGEIPPWQATHGLHTGSHKTRVHTVLECLPVGLEARRAHGDCSPFFCWETGNLRVCWSACHSHFLWRRPLPRPAPADPLSNFPLQDGVSMKVHPVVSGRFLGGQNHPPGQGRGTAALSVQGGWLLRRRPRLRPGVFP